MARYTRKQYIIPQRYKFILVFEGERTEEQYFKHLRRFCPDVCIDYYRQKASSPAYLLQGMKLILKKEKLDDNYEAWIVMDKDEWKSQHIDDIKNWTEMNNLYFYAISYPKFEFWLLLHFEDLSELGKKIDAKMCDKKVKLHLKGVKDIDTSKIKLEYVRNAIDRSRKRCKQVGDSPDDGIARTNVHELVEKILGKSSCSE